MFKTCQTIALFILILFIIFPAQAIELRFPVACRVMENCWITNHVDLQLTSPIIEDYACGTKSSQSNKSTHISLESKKAAGQNIPVIAAAGGVVADAGHQGGFCGTRVLIEHDDGWKTSYCHLNPENLFVRAGQEVAPGQIIGTVGTSGQATWPRLSFTVIRNGMIFDPFSGGTNIEGCLASPNPLWIGGKNPPYAPAQITSVGFTVGYPDNAQILNGMDYATKISSEAPQIALWALLMSVQKGDTISLKITNPDGRVIIENQHISDKTLDQYPIYISKRRGNLLWDIGQYKGEIKITRDVNGNEISVGKQITFEMIQTE